MLTKPYLRTLRPETTGVFSMDYVKDLRFAKDALHLIRSFKLLQADLVELFDFIEPADSNLATYSFRLHSLLARACMEAEANCKAILREHGYMKAGGGDWNMQDYRKIEATHRLSEFEVLFPIWTGSQNARKPFSAWSGTQSLSWYRAYNDSKHDRHKEFSNASLENAIDAVTGVLVLLSAQFGTEDFMPSPGMYAITLGSGPRSDGAGLAIGDYFSVRFPEWPTAERYDFDWSNLKLQDDPFERFTY
ncbi:MAG TPA: hypothetical protein VGO85_19945 [Caldimonas sp.]|jgi:hypothetical protein|nr:hypothetical protein [Caldimonas sp.]